MSRNAVLEPAMLNLARLRYDSYVQHKLADIDPNKGHPDLPPGQGLATITALKLANTASNDQDASPEY